MKDSQKKLKINSNYRFNPLDPRNWRLFCQINVVCSLLLIVDWSLGVYFTNSIERYSFLAKAFLGDSFFISTYPLITFLVMLSLSPLLNNDLDELPFFVAIILKILIYLGACQYTLLGRIVISFLNFACSFVIIFVMVFIIIFEIEQPIKGIQVLMIALLLLTVDLLMNIILFGWRIEESWAFMYIMASLVGILLMKKNQMFLGAVIISIMAILNDYILPIGMNGLDAGTEVMKFGAIFFLIMNIPKK